MKMLLLAASAAALLSAGSAWAETSYGNGEPDDPRGFSGGRFGGGDSYGGNDFGMPITTKRGVFSTGGGHDSASVGAGRGSATTGGGGWGSQSSRETSGDY